MHNAIEAGVRNAAGEPLLVQIGGIRVAIRRGARALQQRKQVLNPVVGRQRATHQIRQQQLALAERRDDAILGDGASRHCRAFSVVRKHDVTRVLVPAIG